MKPDDPARHFTDIPSKAPKVLGILSIVFGGVVVLLTLVGLSMSGAGSMRSLGLQTVEAFERYAAAIEPSASILMITMILMSVALIAIGIGQVGYRRWARSASIVWSAVGLVVLAALVVQHYVVVVPAFDTHVLGAFSDDPQVAQFMSGATKSGGILSLVMYAPYPIILMMIMRRPGVVASMTR